MLHYLKANSQLCRTWLTRVVPTSIPKGKCCEISILQNLKASSQAFGTSVTRAVPTSSRKAIVVKNPFSYLSAIVSKDEWPSVTRVCGLNEIRPCVTY